MDNNITIPDFGKCSEEDAILFISQIIETYQIICNCKIRYGKDPSNQMVYRLLSQGKEPDRELQDIAIEESEHLEVIKSLAFRRMLLIIRDFTRIFDVTH